MAEAQAALADTAVLDRALPNLHVQAQEAKPLGRRQDNKPT